jgi:outer membrane protein TolC
MSFRYARALSLTTALALPLASGAQEPSGPIPSPESTLPQPPPPTGATNELRLTLQQAEDLALEHNLDLAVARTGPEIASELESQALGVYDPLGFTEYRFDHRETPFASAVQSAFGTSGTKIDEDQWDYIGGMRGVIPWGIQYSTAYNFRRLDSSSGFQALERDNRPSWISTATLPLLKDFRYNAADVAVKRTRITSDISDEDYRRFVTDLVVQVDAFYWNLVARRAEEGVALKSLEVAKDLLEQTKVQYQVGVVSKVLVTQAVAGVAEREVGFIQAQNRASAAQDDLLNVILVPDVERYRTTRVITEDPTYVEYPVDEDAAVARAMELRPELAAARKRVEDAELQLTYAKNQRLPRLDLTGSYTFSGLAGPQKVPPDVGLFPNQAVPPQVDSAGDQFCSGRPFIAGDGLGCGFTPNLNQPTTTRDAIPIHADDAHDDFFDASGAHGWAAGVRVEIPIGNRTARSVAVQREIELRRARTELKRQEQAVVLDVRNAGRNVTDAIAALQAAARRRDAQAETLRAEQERLRLGDSTPRDVLEFERDLQDAERQMIGAGQVFRTAITTFERAQASLLETRGIDLAAIPGP